MISVRSRVLAVLLLVAGCDDAPASPEPDAREEKTDGSKPDVASVLGALTAKTPASRPEKDGKRRPKSILLAETRELVQWRVADGFLERADIIELAMGAADGRESLRSEVEKVVDEELAAHQKREADWKFLTAPDRLARAFAALEKDKVIARERFSDCRKCGVADMKLLREDLLEKGRRADGYLFFTDQDADGVSKAGELVLEYGSFRDDEEASARIGDRVTQALRAQGLTVVAETDEDQASYLVLTGLDWQKRRFTRPPR
ncbi:MAG: hypothetical protein Q8S33_19470 [Myxococcales bacterium]|nr:hypothetical protein [Myxococcales bacterium]MDP3502526.1 hypothetical protein [Myxococcales bacterium]